MNENEGMEDKLPSIASMSGFIKSFPQNPKPPNEYPALMNTAQYPSVVVQKEPKGRALDYAISKMMGDYKVKEGDETEPKHCSHVGWFYSPFDGTYFKAADHGVRAYSSDHGANNVMISWWVQNHGGINIMPYSNKGEVCYTVEAMYLRHSIEFPYWKRTRMDIDDPLQICRAVATVIYRAGKERGL